MVTRVSIDPLRTHRYVVVNRSESTSLAFAEHVKVVVVVPDVGDIDGEAVGAVLLMVSKRRPIRKVVVEINLITNISIIL